jgi:hypothetical protein
MKYVRLADWSAYVRAPVDAVMVALKGYLDNSGDEIDPQHAAMSLAGFVTQVGHWDKFEDGWRMVLTKYQVAYSHMKELHKRVGPFEGWTNDEDGREKEKNFLADLVQVVAEAKLDGYGIIVALDDLARFNTENSTQIDPLALCFLSQGMGIQLAYPEDEVQIVVDPIHNAQERLTLARGYIRSNPTTPDAIDRLPIFTLLNQKSAISARNCPALQAADFLAWELRKHYELKKEWFATEHKQLRPGEDPWFSLMTWEARRRYQSAILKGFIPTKTNPFVIPTRLSRTSLAMLANASTARLGIWDTAALHAHHALRNGVWT